MGLPQGLLWSAVLLISLGVLIKGADWFTGAAERLGLALGMPTFLVGVTIVGFGTSLPELVASILAVVRGAPEIVLGTVVGSNIANLLLILGLAAAIAGEIRVKYELLSVDLPFLAGAAFLLALVAWDGRVGLVEAGLCLAGLGLYLGYALSGRHRPGEGTDAPASGVPGSPWWRTPVVLAGSGGLVYLGADHTVRSVIALADLAGIGAEVVAATAVAIGTSLPEIAVTLAATRRGQPEIAVGNVIGSNVFNSLGVLGVSGLLGPLPVPPTILDLALPVMLAATLLAFFMIMEKEMTRWEGGLLLLLYAYFLGAVLGLT